jgi:hypothetical protein
MRNDSSAIHFRKELQAVIASGASLLNPEQRQSTIDYLKSSIKGSCFVNALGHIDIINAFYTFACLKALDGAEKYESTLINTLKKCEDPGHMDIQTLEALAASWSLVTQEAPDKFLPSEIADRLEALRCMDGAWSHITRSRHCSVYGTYLAFSAFQCLEKPIPDEAKVIKSLNALKSKDGAFSHEMDSEHGSIPSTYFSIALLKSMEEEPAHQLAHWVLGQQSDDGGFLAARIMPFADTSSTAYGLHALKLMNKNFDHLNTSISEYLNDLILNTGGFSAHCRAPEADVVSTYYGLAALGFLDN